MPPTPAPGAIWIHGASLGEHRAVQALCSKIKQPCWRSHSSWRSTVKDSFPAPLDAPWLIGPWLDSARPRVLILIEAELWPGWLHQCRKRGIPVYVVNFRESRSTLHWKRLGLWKELTKAVVFLSQQEFGDIKLEAPTKDCPVQLPQPLLCAGSTRIGDEEMLLRALSQIENPPFTIIAPRHLSRILKIKSLIADYGFSVALQSEWKGEPVEIVVLDSHGELANLYAQASCAFVGGTFSEDIGGHSPAEALRFGLPIIAGPHRWSNAEAWKEVLLFQVTSSSECTLAIEKAIQLGPSTVQTTNIVHNYLLQMDLNSIIPQETPKRPWLFWAQPLWTLIGRRLPAYTPQQQHWTIPVVSVGSLAAGGSGKTPICQYLAQKLEGSAVISRGYGRPNGNDLRTEEDLGDELEMLKRKGITVFSSPDRTKGIQAAIECGSKIAILDDAFGHRAVHRDIDILCIDCRWPTSRGLIPVGWAREPWESSHRSDWIWLHNFHPDYPLPSLPNKPIVRSWVEASHWRYKGEELPLEHFSGKGKVICGIARPEGFIQLLHDLNITIDEWKILADHAGMPEGIDEWICTAKDAARLPENSPIWVLETRLRTQGDEELLEELRLCCG